MGYEPLKFQRAGPLLVLNSNWKLPEGDWGLVKSIANAGAPTPVAKVAKRLRATGLNKVFIMIQLLLGKMDLLPANAAAQGVEVHFRAGKGEHKVGSFVSINTLQENFRLPGDG